MRRSIATPCPVAPSQSRIVDETFADDTTTNLEYTTAFHASFRNVRPKRGQIARRGTVNFAIHEDEEPAGPLEVKRVEEQSKLLHPAKRVVAQTKHQDGLEKLKIPAPIAKSPIHVHNIKARRLPIAPKRVPARNSALPDIQLEEVKNPVVPLEAAADRPARRKTLYIPSDDTTQPTMWMGIFSPIKHEVDQNRSGQGQNPVEFEGIAAQMAEKRMRRTANNQARAKRLPLQHNSTVQAQAFEGPDRVGAPTGKENLPPGHRRPLKQLSEIAVNEHEERPKPDRDLQRKNFITQARIDKMSRSRTQSGPNSPEICTMYEIGQGNQKLNVEKPKRAAWNAGPRAIVKDERTPKKQKNAEELSSDSHYPPQSVPTTIPTRFVQPLLHDVALCPPRAPIVEHIEHPEMYEEDWLSQQEIAITQLLNKILSQAHDSNVGTTSRDELRSKLLDRYNRQDICMVYGRVQAASLYGSLSLTHEAIFQIQSLVNDVGRRKAFLKFWLDNYDSELLGTALEVISGRQIEVPMARKSMGSSPGKTVKRQNLARFIESFILRHEDSQFKAAGSGIASDLGSRTILKSLMLVKALDLLKEDQIAGICLFRKKSNIKASLTAVQNLIQMLNPAVGDSIRALRQLGYTVSHQQEPVDELTCQIENIAVDLRDGVCLTRLVEVLLYRSRASRCHHDIPQLQTDTIAVSEEQTISFSRQEDHPLSRHLKIPCSSRAAKIWNVQIALGALRHVKNLESLIEDIRPDDIVDGYREKTIKVLWTIVGRCGLAGFIDKDDLRQEVRRLGGCHIVSEDCIDEDEAPKSQIESEALIRRWVEAVASSKGLQVRNLTTSFSDGRVFEAILDEYEPYLARNCEVKTAPLHERLAQLGCSRQFSSLFSSKDGQVHIFGKDFVLAALAFLCSRVVGPSKLCRSAIRIQRCWRKHSNKIQQIRRAVKRDLAEACAASVCLRTNRLADDKILTSGDLSDASTEDTAKTEIDEDIWLSL